MTKKGKAKPRRKYNWVCVGEDMCCYAVGDKCTEGAKKGRLCCLPRVRGG